MPTRPHAAGKEPVAPYARGGMAPLYGCCKGCCSLSIASLAELTIVEPTDVYVLEATDAATLTLVTCYPFYFIGEAPQRYID